MNSEVPSKRKLMSPEAYAYYMLHPVEFVQDLILRLTPAEVIADVVGRRLEPQTKEILRAVAAHDYVSVFSGRGCTKTFSLAMLVIWWVWTRRDSRVIVTSPKYDTLKATLWAEVGKWLNQSNVKDEIELTGEKIYHVDKDMVAFGHPMTAKDKENISGFHATHMLFLIDEASNVDREIIDAIIGGMNDPEAKIVMAGNPTLASGAFFDTHNKDRKFWYKIRFSSEHSARKSKVWFERMQRYPKNSDLYRVYVDGLPPLGNPKAVIALSDCHAAKERIVEQEDYLEMGVDPAREGDDMATIAIRRGKRLLEIRAYAKTKGPELERLVLTMLREYRKKTRIRTKVRIKIDDHSIGGPIGDYLALNTTDNIEVIPCLFNGEGNDQYGDSAAMMWGNMADIIDEVALCDDEELIEELSTREWAPGVGRLKVESKSIYKGRVGKSPDRADACILCYYGGVRKVFSKPDNLGAEDPTVSEFTIDWHYANLTNPAFDGIFMIDVLHYAAVVFNDDLSVNCLAAIYQQYADRLWLYAEFYQDNPEPDMLAQRVKRMTRYGVYPDERNVRVLGNSSMFSTSPDRRPLSDILLSSQLYVAQPERYDEYGATALGIKMYGRGDIRIHKDLENVRKAVNLWMVRKGRIDADENGFVKGLLIILSEVIKRRKGREAVVKPRDYTPVGITVKREKTTNEWCGR